VVAILAYFWTSILTGSALGSNTAADLLGLTSAAVSVAANSLLVAIRALDGSDETAQLKGRTARLWPQYTRSRRLQESAGHDHAVPTYGVSWPTADPEFVQQDPYLKSSWKTVNERLHYLYGILGPPPMKSLVGSRDD
jgi:hypothetical protein